MDSTLQHIDAMQHAQSDIWDTLKTMTLTIVACKEEIKELHKEIKSLKARLGEIEGL